MATDKQSTATRYQVEGENLPGGRAHIVAHNGAIPFDGSAETGQELPGPADLLAAALAACVLKNVERFSLMLPFEYRRATVHVVVEREEPPPHIVRARYDLRVETGESDYKVDLLARNIRKFGTITNTLAAALDLQGEVTPVRGPEDRKP